MTLVEWRETDEGLIAYRDGKRVVWAPQPGSQETFLGCPTFEVLYEGPRGGGKGLPLDEPVMTPTGERRIGDLKVGNQVLAPDGTRSYVIGVYPQGERPTFEIEFDDGAIARCDDQHIWPIHVVGLKPDRTIPYKLATMPEVVRQLEAGRRVLIPTLDRLEFQRSPKGGHLVDPYLLGLLLGDGTFRDWGSVALVTMDDEIASTVLSHGFKEHPSDRRNGLRSFTHTDDAIKAATSALGLRGKRAEEKFVPRRYLFCSSKDRLAILQGILDTDGTAGASGRTDFSSCSRQLAMDVQFLARSLGAKASLRNKKCFCNGKQALDAFIVHIQPGRKFIPFRLKRKAERVVGYQHEVLRRRIVRATPLGPQDTVCIKLDSPSGLFVTRDFVVTHNTDCLLMDFAQHVGKGYGSEWRGILFRQTFPQLSDVIQKSKKWFPMMFPGITFNETKVTWTWPTGESLRFWYMQDEGDYWNFHGHAFPWIAWEELTTWPDLTLYLKMFSCSRSTRKNMPRRIRATTNPFGPGHNAVKARFRLPSLPGSPVGVLIQEKSARGEPLERISIRSALIDNKVLLHAEPDYIDKLRMSSKSPAQLKAWLEGDWTIVAGGMFDDLWTPDVHLIPDIPFNRIPKHWRLDRSYDHGQSKPFSVGWWAESNGEPIVTPRRDIGTVRGDLIRFAEWYGWNGQPNEGLRMLAGQIGDGIRERQREWKLDGRIRRGPADNNIFYDYEPGRSISSEMAKRGVYWSRSDKKSGSRKHGWEQFRDRLKASLPGKEGVREKPGIFICYRCSDFIRTIPALPRDEKDPDDLDTRSEDHIADEVRYRLLHRASSIGVDSF